MDAAGESFRWAAGFVLGALSAILIEFARGQLERRQRRQDRRDDFQRETLPLQRHFVSDRDRLLTFAGSREKMDGAPSGPGLAAIARYADAWKELHARIGRRFARAEARERAGRYLAGLLERVPRKNGWQLAEAIGETGPRGVQRLLSAATWDADGVRDDLRAYVVGHLGDAATGVLIVDETGFLKKGKKSCGVARQYTGTAGDTVNCQVGVFLTYASAAGSAFIDRALYLPQEWTGDRDRRAEAGIPAETRFATKIELAQRMLARAFDAEVPARWVVGDAFYGRSHALRQWLEERGRAYALMIPKTNVVRYQGQRERAEQLGERLCPDLLF